MGTTEGWTFTTFVVSIYYREKRKSQIQFVTVLKFDDLHIEHVEIKQKIRTENIATLHAWPFP